MHILAACVMTTMLVDCATGLRFYSSELRSKKEVALIYAACSLDSITQEGQEKMDIINNSFISEVLPGKYVLELRYVHQGTYNNEHGGKVMYPLQTVAGHVYFIYPEFPALGIWRPAVIDIVRDEDYRKITYRNPEKVKKWVDNYLAGSRTIAKKEEVSTSKGVITIWR